MNKDTVPQEKCLCPMKLEPHLRISSCLRAMAGSSFFGTRWASWPRNFKGRSLSLFKASHPRCRHQQIARRRCDSQIHAPSCVRCRVGKCFLELRHWTRPGSELAARPRTVTVITARTSSRFYGSSFALSMGLSARRRSLSADS